VFANSSTLLGTLVVIARVVTVQAMRFTELCHHVGAKILSTGMDHELQAVTDDSRSASAQSVMVIRQGGEAYLNEVLNAGVRGIMAAESSQNGIAPIIESFSKANTTTASEIGLAVLPTLGQPEAGRIAEAFHDHPAKKLQLLGVTGTNGKTTAVWLMRHLLRAAQCKPAMIGTIEIDEGGSPNSPTGPRPASLTTPGSIALTETLAKAVEQGCQAAVMEVSSHALDQGRVGHLSFDVGVFTNLTGDHLDYHKTMEAYADAKAKLFESLDPSALAVVNQDDPWSERMLANCQAKTLYTNDAPEESTQGATLADVSVTIHAMTSQGSDITVTGPWGSQRVFLPLVGRHNIANALSAVAGCSGIVEITPRVIESLADVAPVPGRLEKVPSPSFPVTGITTSDTSLPNVLVDYAHTHDALENVLRALRPLVDPQGKLICIIGCGGDRDKTKRPKMAKIAADLADQVILTSDNPRTESPEAILKDMLVGVDSSNNSHVQVIEDRAQAIADTLAHVNHHDTVLIAGKGHEDYQIVGQSKHLFDDRQHAVQALEKQFQQIEAFDSSTSPGTTA